MRTPFVGTYYLVFPSYNLSLSQCSPSRPLHQTVTGATLPTAVAIYTDGVSKNFIGIFAVLFEIFRSLAHDVSHFFRNIPQFLILWLGKDPEEGAA